MASITDLRARREALAAQRTSGVARVSYDGKTVDYRSLAEIDRAIEAIGHGRINEPVSVKGPADLQALGRHDLGQQAARRIGRQQLVVDGDAFAVDLDQRRRVDRQVDVGRLLLAHQAQNPLHRAHVFPQIRVLSLFLDRCHALLT